VRLEKFWANMVPDQVKRHRHCGNIFSVGFEELRRSKNKDEGLVRIDCYVPDELLKAVRRSISGYDRRIDNPWSQTPALGLKRES
jgi:hypothetical protein